MYPAVVDLDVGRELIALLEFHRIFTVNKGSMSGFSYQQVNTWVDK